MASLSLSKDIFFLLQTNTSNLDRELPGWCCCLSKNQGVGKVGGKILCNHYVWDGSFLQQENQSSDCPDNAHNKPHPNQRCVQRAASLKIHCKQSDSSTSSEFCLTCKGSCRDSGSVSTDTICGFWEYNDIYFVPFTCSSIGLKSSSSGKSPPHPTFHADVLGWSLISLWVWLSSKLLRWFSGDFSC